MAVEAFFTLQTNDLCEKSFSLERKTKMLVKLFLCKLSSPVFAPFSPPYFLSLGVTGWLYYLLNIWPFTAKKIYPKAKNANEG